MRVLFFVFLFSLALFAEQTYKFGVFPHMPLKKLHAVFDVVTKDLETQLDRPVVLMTKPYYKLYKEELNRGIYDFAFIQPLDYVQAHELQGYIPLARRAEDLRSIMVVLKASNYNDIEDIKDRVIASAPAQAAVTKMMLASLEKEGYRVLDDFTLSYSKNHFICLQKLVDAKAAACITAKRSVEFFNQEKGVNSFKIIYETKALPHALFVAHPRVPLETRKLIEKRILSWDSDEKGRLMLKKGRLLNFIKARDTDYGSVREFMKVEVK